MLSEKDKQEIEDLKSKLATLGCGDNSCIIVQRGGQGTNGGCRCFDCYNPTKEDMVALRRKTRAALIYYRQMIEIYKKA